MIDQIEIENRARELGLLRRHVEKDYVLCHVLAAISDGDPLLVFRGGTALARVYWPEFRLSEDLDFISTAPSGAIAASLAEAVDVARTTTGFDLELRLPPLKTGWARGEVESNEVGPIQLDISRGESPALPAQRRPIDLPYSDLGDHPHEIEVMELEEILANKWYMLDAREEPRDLFDFWTGICTRGVDVEAVANAFTVKYATRPGVWRIERAARLAQAWDGRLAHQVPDLPPFDRVLDEVRERIGVWVRQDRRKGH